MKSSIIFSRSILASFVAVGVLSFLASTDAFADGKGASFLMPAKTPGTVIQAQTATGHQPAMSCPRCKDGFVAVQETNPKGMRMASVKSVPTHLCPACSTKIASVGSGKAKTDKVTHTCGNSANSEASCCMAAR